MKPEQSGEQTAVWHEATVEWPPQSKDWHTIVCTCTNGDHSYLAKASTNLIIANARIAGAVPGVKAALEGLKLLTASFPAIHHRTYEDGTIAKAWTMTPFTYAQFVLNWSATQQHVEAALAALENAEQGGE